MELSQTNFNLLTNQVEELKEALNRLQRRPLRTDEAAKYIGVDKSKIVMYRKLGMIGGVKCGHGWIYLQDDLDGMIREYAGMEIDTEENCLIAIRIKEELKKLKPAGGQTGQAKMS